MCLLTHLSSFVVSTQANDNKITHIPESISQLRELSELSLQYNSLQVLPNSLCLAGSRSEGGRGSSVMRVFNLRGNPLLHPPMDVVVEGTDAILRYLRAQYSGGQSSSSQERPGETKASTSTRVTSSKVEAEVDEAFDSVYTEYKFTELHREVQELIEKVSVVPAESLGTSASGPGGSATQASPSRLKREIPTSVRSSPQRTLSPIAASAKGKQPLSPAKLYTGRTLFANKSSPAQRSRMDDLHECMTSSSTPTVTSQNAPVQSPDGRQGRFVRSLFAEQQTSNALQGLSLEGCLTVNGGKPAPKDEESEQRRGGQQAEGNSRDAPTIEPKASSVAALRTPTTEPVDEEYLDIVQNLLRERNPALADTFEREIVNTISDEDEESSEDDSPVQSLPEVPASQKSPDISKLPKAFLCPITHDIMKDPVVLSDGHTYERSAIEKWIKILGRRTSPMTGLPLPHIDLTPNFTLKSMIVESCK